MAVVIFFKDRKEMNTVSSIAETVRCSLQSSVIRQFDFVFEWFSSDIYAFSLS